MPNLEYCQQPLLQRILQPLRWGEICIRKYKQTKYDSKQHKIFCSLTHTHTHIYIYIYIYICVCQFCITNILHKYVINTFCHCQSSISNVSKIGFEYVRAIVLLQIGCNSMVTGQYGTVHRVLTVHG